LDFHFSATTTDDDDNNETKLTAKNDSPQIIMIEIASRKLHCKIAEEKNQTGYEYQNPS
jgi:hypothetical protein